MTFQKNDCVMILDPDNAYAGRYAVVANVVEIAGKEIVTVEIVDQFGVISFVCNAKELI